jgi:hypothetical protein
MLDRVDRMLVAVRSRQQAGDRFSQLLGATRQDEIKSEHLNAVCLRMAVGESEFELCEPLGNGPVQSHLDQWGEGLMIAGYASARLNDLTAHWDTTGVAYTPADNRVYLAGEVTAGFPMVVSPLGETRARQPGCPISFLYEATNTLDSPWQQVADKYTEMFQLDASRYSPIANDRFAYEGTLTLFDPPNRLDRIELSQTFADKPQPMRRFVERRGGDSLYMCFVETHAFDQLKSHLINEGVTLATRGQDLAAERNSMWVHPKDLYGVLLGISRTGFAWQWSGRPEMVPPLATE